MAAAGGLTDPAIGMAVPAAAAGLADAGLTVPAILAGWLACYWVAVFSSTID